MSASFVIDASIAFAWVHPDQATLETDRLLKAVESGATVIVPGLWFLEVANGLLILQRRKRLSAEDRRSALETLSMLNLAVDDDSNRAAFQKTSELAEKHGLTIYDASYLELSLRRKVPLASRDEALRTVAKRCGVKAP